MSYFFGYFFILFLLSLLYLLIGKHFLTLILGLSKDMFQKVDITSTSSLISQICTIMTSDGDGCLEVIAGIIVLSATYIVFLLTILYSALNSIYLGYITIITIRNKYKKG